MDVFIILLVLIHFSGASEVQANDEHCFHWEKPYPDNGANIQDMYHECEVFTARDVVDPQRFLCVFEKANLITASGLPNLPKLIELTNYYSYPKVLENVLQLFATCALKLPMLNNYLTCVAEELNKLCPNDPIFGE